MQTPYSSTTEGRFFCNERIGDTNPKRHIAWVANTFSMWDETNQYLVGYFVHYITYYGKTIVPRDPTVTNYMTLDTDYYNPLPADGTNMTNDYLFINSDEPLTHEVVRDFWLEKFVK